MALGRKNFLFLGSDNGGERAACMYTLIGSAPCRMRHGAVHAERRTMPNEVRSMIENDGIYRRPFAIGLNSTRHSTVHHRAWRNCSSRSGGRCRPLGRALIAGIFASAASFNAI